MFKMKNLSLEEIAKFANRKYVKKIAVENLRCPIVWLE